MAEGIPTPTPPAKRAKKRPFRLKSPQATESQLQAAILDYLRHEQNRGRIGPFCRVNGGGARMSRGRSVAFYRLYLPGMPESSKGHADLYGLYGPRSAHPGRYFALEVKRPGEAPTPEQRAFLDAVRCAGGLAAVVFSFVDVQSVLFGEIDVHAVENAREAE